MKFVPTPRVRCATLGCVVQPLRGKYDRPEQSLCRAHAGVEVTLATDVLRPPPEHFLTLIRQQQRGRLKIYLGFAAGVGKTFEMLQEAHRLKRQGVDAVVGVVETHGRAETAALVEGLELVPRRRIEY